MSAAALRRVALIAGTLAMAEFRLRYMEAKLSYLWTIAHPLAFFAVLYAVFTQIGRFHTGVEHYPVYLLMTIVLWTYFADACSRALNCMVRRAEVLRKVRIPHVTIPLAVVLTSLLDLGMNLIAVLIFMLASGVTPRLSWLELPVLVGLLSVFATGAALILSSMYVRYRDMDQIWSLVRQALFYGSPIFYVAAMYPDNVEHVLSANPIAAIFTQARHALIDPGAPSAAAAAGGAVWLLIPLGIIATVFVAGIWVFRRESPRIAERL